MSKTLVAVQSRGPGNTHRKGTYFQLGSPAICVCVWLCACMQTNGLLYLIPTTTHPNVIIQMIILGAGSKIFRLHSTALSPESKCQKSEAHITQYGFRESRQSV